MTDIIDWKEDDILINKDGVQCVFSRYASNRIDAFIDAAGEPHIIRLWQLYTEPKQSENVWVNPPCDETDRPRTAVECERAVRREAEQSELERDGTDRGEPEQVDTSTPEGWEKVYDAWKSGEEYERKYVRRSDPWESHSEHPVTWNRVDYIYRIKQTRVPQVEEIWDFIEDGEHDRCYVIEVEDDDYTCISKTRGYLEICHHDKSEINKYIGHSDTIQGGLSLLKGGE